MEKVSKLRRWLHYYLDALSFLQFLNNWYWIPLMYVGIVRNRVFELKNGLRFFCSDHMEALTIKEVASDNEYHIKTRKNGMTIVDIGANIGAFSVYAASLSAKNKVICFEPATSTYEQLRHNLALNNLTTQVIPVKKAVYKSVTKLKLHKAANSGMNSLINYRKVKDFEIIETTTLEKIFSDHKISRCNFLKLDCEGAEYDILLNLPTRVFSKIDEIAMECHHLDKKHQPEILVKQLEDNGYKVVFRPHHIESNISYIHAKRLN